MKWYITQEGFSFHSNLQEIKNHIHMMIIPWSHSSPLPLPAEWGTQTVVQEQLARGTGVDSMAGGSESHSQQVHSLEPF